MAEHQIEARILLRYDTISNWYNSEIILKKGEAAVALYPSRKTLGKTDNEPDNTPPAVGIKIGDGVHYFDELPWVQGIAADVYNWAKQSTKPTYEASEISGLAEYISTHSGGNGSGSNGTGGIYRIIYNAQTQKYILQIYNTADEYWEDTDSEIDFSSVSSRLNALENWANGFSTNIGNIELPLMAFIIDGLNDYLSRLEVEDNKVAHQFVTSVSQHNGKIAVKRDGITANDISGGILPTMYGGTGLEEVFEGSVLAGSANGEIVLKNYTNRIINDERSDLTTAGAVIDYVTNATAGLTGAMHFIGEATVTIANNSSIDPQINGYVFRNAQLGDVILGNNKEEYVWTGSIWRLLGDEGSYAVKGAITNADIADNAAINISKINNLSNLLDSKVDKQEGKILTSNDFTNEYKNKLDNIEEEAQKNLIEHIYINDVEVRPTTVDDVANVISFRMSSLTEEEAEQLRQTSEKVQTIETNAQVNKIESISIDGDKQTPDSEKNVNIALAPYTNVIESISLNNGSPLSVVNKNVNINLDESALAFEVITGADVPGDTANDRQISIINKRLQLARISKTGSIYDITNLNNKYTITTPVAEQDQEEYIILNCGNAQKLIDNFSILNN